MNENSHTPKCPRCGATVAADAPEGLCPRCLMALNLATQTELPEDDASPAGAKVLQPRHEAPPSPADVARHFPQLEIIECLGRGGMGVVYKARQTKLNRLVALKILAPEKEREAKFAGRFAGEAQALARLNHPNIVTVHDFGEADGLYYLLMEFVDGASLRQLLQSRKIGPEEALAIVPKICEALQYAHEQGIVHRDIKPENVLLDKHGRVKIADFGIAKLLGREHDQEAGTEDRRVVGTPHYMAPEQIEHPLAVDHRADIYSLGVVFYEMLTGELPLGKFPPPSRKAQVDVRLDEVVLHALEKEPERRYQQASEVKTDVETITRSATALVASGGAPPLGTAADVSGETPKMARETPPHSQTPPRRDWLTWWAAWSPFRSPEVREICTHFTKEERNQMGFLGLLFGVWYAAAISAIPALIKSNPGPGNWIVASVLGILFIVSFPVGQRTLRRFLCSTAWAKERGFTPEQLRMFSFRGSNLWKGIGVYVVLLLLVLAVNETMISYLGLPFHSSGTRDLQVDGRVTDAVTHQPIARARVVGLMSKARGDEVPPGTRTATNGWFTLNTWHEPHALAVSARGYSTQLITLRPRSFSRERSMLRNVRLLPTNAAPLVLGPVIERVLSAEHPASTNSMLDLDDGRLLTPPPGMNLADPWPAQNGVDLMVATVPGLRGLMGLDLVTASVLGNAWETITPTCIEEALGSVSPVAQVGLTAQRALPETYLFQTREGGMGILQITGFTDNPPGVKLRYKLVQSNATPNPPLPAALAVKTIVLTRATNQLVGESVDVRTVSVWTDTQLQPGDALRARVRTPDGEMQDASSTLFVQCKPGKVRTSSVFTWFLRDTFGEKEAEAAVAQIRENMTERPIALTSNQPLELFSVTNRFGGLMVGYAEFVRSEPASPGTTAGTTARVRALVRIKRFTGYFPSLDYSAEVPPGYALRATASDGEATTHTPAGPFEYSSTWFLPHRSPPPSTQMQRWGEQRQSQQASWQAHMQELQDRGPLEVGLGEPRLLFSITNSPGDVFEGFLELAGPNPEANR